MAKGMPLPAVVAITVVVLAGTSGTVLLARDAGSSSDRSSAIPPAARSASSPSVPPTAPAVLVTATPAAATPSSRAAPGSSTTPAASPSLRIVVSPPPSYGGPAPQPILGGATPGPTPQESRVTPDQLSWAVNQQGQQSRPQSVVIVNTGGSPLHVFPAGIAGDQAGDFAIQSDTCSGATVLPQQECQVAIVYKAIDVRASAELRVSDDSGGSAPGSPTKTSSVPLSGTAG